MGRRWLFDDVRWVKPVRSAFTALAVLGCGNPVGTVDDVRVDFRLEPSVVRAGDSMTVSLVINNPTGDTVRLVSRSSCVATIDVLVDDERLDMQGTGFGCLAVITTFLIPPGDSLTRTFDLVAWLRENRAPWRYIDPPPPGVYQLQAAMHVELPDQEREFRVTL
jgi:hypothetical protein